MISENVAHADTPGYRARDIADFATTLESTPAFAARTTRPGHIGFGADARGFEPREATAFGAETPNGNTVSLEDQMIRAAGGAAEPRDGARGLCQVARDPAHRARAGPLGSARRMDEMMKTMAASASGMAAQAARLRLTSENIANADTPGYRRKTVSFEETFQRTGDARAVATGPVRLDPAELERVYDPTHPLANAEGYFQSSNVDLIVEIADAREANRSYEANLRMFEQARQMASSLLELLRR